MHYTVRINQLFGLLPKDTVNIPGEKIEDIASGSVTAGLTTHPQMRIFKLTDFHHMHKVQELFQYDSCGSGTYSSVKAFPERFVDLQDVVIKFIKVDKEA